MDRTRLMTFTLAAMAAGLPLALRADDPPDAPLTQSQIVSGLNLFAPPRPVRVLRQRPDALQIKSAAALNFFRRAEQGSTAPRSRNEQLRQFTRAYTGPHWVARGETTRQQLIRHYGFSARDLAGLSEQDCRALLGAIRTRSLPAGLVP